MYTFKSIVRRGMLFGATAALVGVAVIPAAAVFADALNPLTQRSLLLSSSAPGFQDTDGAGNSDDNPNAWNGGEYYAPPGSGPNGKKTGETFTFRVSTDSAETLTPLKAISLQYCTSAAGKCQAPGNNTGDADPNKDGDLADSTREANSAAHADKRSDFEVVTDGTTPWGEGAGAGKYQVSVNGVATSGWVMATKNVESADHSGAKTGKHNFIYLINTTGISPEFNDQIEVKFVPDDDNYITNPGADAFFVKINTYKTDTEASLLPTTEANIVDGGVTVANVMTDSIHITTKVLETMAFSVGTQNPDTQNVQHGSCDAVTVVDNNRLQLGDSNAEYSLETTEANDVYSYWRLSSNSSGGATVYYSGDTLRNTVGDHIADMTTKQHSQPGTEQFGLALVNPLKVGNNVGDVMDTLHTDGFPSNWITPTTAPLIIEGDYNGGDVASISDATTANNAQFTFKMASQTVPVIVAQENTEVISCATSKVRYIGNIAADTPAGVYTTKINFLAAPQY